ncbi:MAG: HD domain-containing protein, partial [Symbiobacteriaceae bacterium]|nr:HD domain-containing protein [Symbiobacteriaceae bacterium]
MIQDMPSPSKRLVAKGHLDGVSLCCTLLALKRGLNAEIATICGALHDIYTYKTGSSVNHGHNGAEMARVILKRLGDLFDDAETELILSSIFHHSDKSEIHGAYEELLKDADTLSPLLYDVALPPINSPRRVRVESMARELELLLEAGGIIDDPEFAEIPLHKTQENRRAMLSETAASLASAEIVGSRDDAAFMNLIRYFPEDNAADELINNWCAAFVFHCCQEVGFILPIRWLTLPSRFAGISAWTAWAKKLSYFHEGKNGFLPQPGDIVVYNSIIPVANRRADQQHQAVDHMGIVVSCDGKELIAAEGNV